MGTTVKVIKQFFLGSNCYSIRIYDNAPEQLVAFASNPKYKEYACVVTEKPRMHVSLGGRSVNSSNIEEDKEIEYMSLDEYKALRSSDQEEYILTIIDNASREQLEAYLHVSKAKVADLISDKLAE